MKLSIKTTFDFSKLSSNLPKIIEKYSQRYARSSEQGAKANIAKGLAPPLKKSTIEIRKLRKTGGTKPLYNTGNLYRSIKGTSEGLEIADYGKYHHYGFTPKFIPVTDEKRVGFIPNKKGIKVPARPFIYPDQKTVLKAFDKFRKDIRKALKK